MQRAFFPWKFIYFLSSYYYSLSIKDHFLFLSHACTLMKKTLAAEIVYDKDIRVTEQRVRRFFAIVIMILFALIN